MTFPAPFSATAWRMAAIDSCLADSRKPQVLMTVISADWEPSTVCPEFRRTPAISSLSTSFLAHPRVMMRTFPLVSGTGYFGILNVGGLGLEEGDEIFCGLEVVAWDAHAFGGLDVGERIVGEFKLVGRAFECLDNVVEEGRIGFGEPDLKECHQGRFYGWVILKKKGEWSPRRELNS